MIAYLVFFIFYHVSASTTRLKTPRERDVGEIMYCLVYSIPVVCIIKPIRLNIARALSNVIDAVWSNLTITHYIRLKIEN